MKTITLKEVKKLVRLANIASVKALAHDKAQLEFCKAFEEIIGVMFDGNSSNGDPIVDIIDYGADEAKIETFPQMLQEYFEGIGLINGKDYLIE
jgi:hypothetical protein